MRPRYDFAYCMPVTGVRCKNVDCKRHSGRVKDYKGSVPLWYADFTDTCELYDPDYEHIEER